MWLQPLRSRGHEGRDGQDTRGHRGRRGRRPRRGDLAKCGERLGKRGELRRPCSRRARPRAARHRRDLRTARPRCRGGTAAGPPLRFSQHRQREGKEKGEEDQAAHEFSIERREGHRQVQARERPRTRVLSEEEIRELWEIREAEGSVSSAAFRMLLLTAQRKQEVLAMRWTDVHGAWWTIPAGIAKNKLSHRHPVIPVRGG